MSRIAIFSGTSEGRNLSEQLALNGMSVDVFVATEYGEQVINRNDNINIYTGRLNGNEIENYLKKVSPEIIFDATHPHATVITENLKNACKNCSVKYVRVKRHICNLENFDEFVAAEIDEKWCRENVTIVKNIEEAKSIIENKFIAESSREDIMSTNASDKNVNIKKVMLTTGVKELYHFENVPYKDNIIVRVLPGSESIGITEKLNFKRKNIVAMEGPFSAEMNKALIDSYGINLLVTKNSGKRGGFIEKIKACYECNIKVIVVDIETEEDEGISVEDATIYALNLDKKIDKKNDNKSFKIVGAGICRTEYLTVNALEAIKEADIIIGAKRMTDFAGKINTNAKLYNEYQAEKVADIVNNTLCKNIVYLVSGDSGFYSGAKGITRLEKMNIEMIPGISSVSYMASKLQLPYSDMRIISMHGKAFDKNELKVKDEKGFFLLCTDFEDVRETLNCEISSMFHFFVGRNFGMEDEMIVPICPSDNLDILKKDKALYVLAAIKKEITLSANKTNIMIAASSSGSGKTSFASGLMSILNKENENIHAFKCGPDYIDPMFHKSVLGIDSRNLDSYFCDDKTLLEVFLKNSAKVNIIEAAMGLYDGLGASDRYSAYEIAAKLNIPILLVVDAYGMGYSLIALIEGFLSKDYRRLIKGVILNRISDRFYGKISKVIEEELKIKVYGHIRNNVNMTLKSRHLGLLSPEETDFYEALKTIEDEIKKGILYKEIVRDYKNISLCSCDLELDSIEDNDTCNLIDNTLESYVNYNEHKDCGEIVSFDGQKKVKIAVAKDEAFSFIYEDNIELLRKCGAEIVYFSPLNDDTVPKCNGLILYGGYPENYLEKLSCNKSMLYSIRQFVSSNKPVIAECGGFMYLLNGIREEERHKVYETVSVIKGVASKKDGLVRFGYADILIKWKNKTYMIKGHEFHHYDIEEDSVGNEKIYDSDSLIKYASSEENYNGIVVHENLIAGFPHLYYLSCPDFVKDFIKTCGEMEDI